MSHEAYSRPDDLDEYQALVASTAIYPRVYTEDQVREMYAVILPFFAYVQSTVPLPPVDYLLDKYETEFSRMVYPVLGLIGESGEIANKLKKVARDQGGKWNPDLTQDYEAELGDVQWYVAAVATGLKSKLGDIASKNIDKLFSRKARGALGGSGDRR